MTDEVMALKGSIEKWKLIERGKGTDYGPANCPLCQLSSFCEGCIIISATGSSGCEFTPYAEWIDHHETAHSDYSDDEGYKIRCKECARIAKRERMFLESLLPSKEAKG